MISIKNKTAGCGKKGGAEMREINIECICGSRSMVLMVGNNNANGKSVCPCGRHITVHFRRAANKSGEETEQQIAAKAATNNALKLDPPPLPKCSCPIGGSCKNATGDLDTDILCGRSDVR